MEETSLMDFKNNNSGKSDESPRSTLKKILFFLGILLVFLVGFSLGMVYFFNPALIIKYYVSKQNLPFEIDKLDVGLGGGFEFERLRYNIEITRGAKERLQIEFGKGKISPFGFLFSNKLDLEISLTGVKIPLNEGTISGGTWIINVDVGKIKKNTQQWDGDIELNLQNANLQYKVLETKYTAVIREGKIKGKLANGFLTLDTTRIEADIVSVTISGNATINYPYNMNVQLSVLPQPEFEKKYPDEYSMLKSLMQNQAEVKINFSGPLNQMKPSVQNIKLPGF